MLISHSLAAYSAPERGKDNNFNLLRMIAAMAVLFGHCFALLRLPEPLGASLGISLGSIAVDIFFVSSGFLVGASLLQRQSIVDYLVARTLRIFPALWVMLILVVFVLGAIISQHPDYLHDPRIFHHWWKSATLMTGIDFYLPGVFEKNPYPGVVNGSLWSMVYEISMYVVLLLSFLCFLSFKKIMQTTFSVIAAMIFAAGLCYLISDYHLFDTSQFTHLAWMFSYGTLCYVLRDFIPLRPWIAILGVLLGALVLQLGQNAFLWFYCVLLPYLVFCFAYLPKSGLRYYNRLGDYSYGVYIYAFPIQQTLLFFDPSLSPQTLFAVAASLTLLCAIVSWHCVEKPIMGLRPRIVQFLKR
ncbi:MAG: acyltransferase [Burkholderiaceae bacterium]|nr:MAG: acyltransferase [Burkholderiaceae bacterium]